MELLSINPVRACYCKLFFKWKNDRKHVLCSLKELKIKLSQKNKDKTKTTNLMKSNKNKQLLIRYIMTYVGYTRVIFFCYFMNNF